MAYPSVAIIGTAGRKEDKDRLSRHHYDRMLRACTILFRHLDIDHNGIKAYSGGAAWADHLVVTLALLGGLSCENVTLYLPSQLTEDGYVGHDERSTRTADTANYYHRIFSKVTGKNTIRDLLDIQERGAKLVPGNGSFHARNSSVAKAVSPDGLLLAFTFGSPSLHQLPWTIRGFDGTMTADVAGLKDGGTGDTFNKATCRKYHCLIGPTDQGLDLI